MKYRSGTLVAIIVPNDPSHVLCIGRVMGDDGQRVTVRSDDDLEQEAAEEHGFIQPPPRVMIVGYDCIRPILPRVN